ncbi:hypothetical protein PO909_016200, partial [Leuciscus waleckii]
DSQIIAPVFSGSSRIVPLVLVLLVLIIAGLLLVFLCKKYQSQGGDSSSQTGPGKHEVVSHTGCDYEEIKDTHKQLPTNPSDSYNTVEKATSDSQMCITSAEDLNYTVVYFHCNLTVLIVKISGIIRITVNTLLSIISLQIKLQRSILFCR